MEIPTVLVAESFEGSNSFFGVHLDRVVEALLLGVSIFMIVKASHEEAYSLPVLGDLAQKSIAED